MIILVYHRLNCPPLPPPPSLSLSCGDDKSLRVWNYETGEKIKVWDNFHSGLINCSGIYSFINSKNSKKKIVGL